MFSNSKFLFDNEHRILGLMLFSLLAASHMGSSDTAVQGLLITHFGFFLLWQPIVKKQSTFNTRQIIVLSILIFIFIYLFNPWISALWSLLLLTLLTGRIFSQDLARAAYGVAVIILFLDLTLNTTPELFHLAAFSSSIQSTFSLVITILPLTFLFIPVTDTSSAQVDFIRGFLLVLLTIFLCMSSVLISLTAQKAYIESLAISAIILSLFLLLAALLWTPRGGFAGLARLWEKYILDIGGPFEEWVTQISTLESNSSHSSEDFLTASLNYFTQQHWICGVSWESNIDSGFRGEKSSNSVNINDEKLRLTLYTHTPVGPSLLLHAKLLLNVLTFYYRAKLQEQQLLKQMHMQAIYETGSKLTHDVKNILQSTKTMSQIINDEDADIQEKFDVLKRQMPLLTQRLNTTLDKLRAPQKTELVTKSPRTSLQLWWSQLKQRYSGRNIDFSADISDDAEIPVDVFTTVIENLLDNARSKQIREPDIKITVKLTESNDKIYLYVTDTGSAINKQIAQQLFKEVVSSQDGYGIGLYQCQELAKNNGYNLAISNNNEGEVAFSLTSA